jgi:hypothetical protein
MQAAKRFDFTSNFFNERGQFDARISAFETVLYLRTRKLMQNHLHHGELVEVRVQQTGNDHVEKGAKKMTLQCT